MTAGSHQVSLHLCSWSHSHVTFLEPCVRHPCIPGLFSMSNLRQPGPGLLTMPKIRTLPQAHAGQGSASPAFPLSWGPPPFSCPGGEQMVDLLGKPSSTNLTSWRRALRHFTVGVPGSGCVCMTVVPRVASSLPKELVLG